MSISDKKKRKWITLLRVLAFLVLVFVLLLRYTKIFMNKRELFCIATLKEYAHNSIDVIFLGGSQMVYAAQPMILWEQYGITSYNMATSATTIPGNYWSAKIAFETQTPRVVMLDCTLSQMETKTFGELPRIHAAIDGLWPSKAAFSAINDLVEDPSKRFEFYWTPYIYHTRWKELSEEDFIKVSDHGSGGAWLINRIENFEDTVSQYNKNYTQTVPSINIEYIEKLKQLCDDNHSELVLTVLPIPMGADYQPIYNTLEGWAKEKGIPFINGYDDPDLWQLDYGTDFADVAHMNIHGVKKSSAYIGNYLTEHYNFALHSDEQLCDFWNEHLQEYIIFRDSIWTYPLLAYGDTITFDAVGNQDQFYGGIGGSDRLIDSSGTFTWTTGPRSDFYFVIEELADASLQFELEAVQPIIGKTTRTVEIYINEQCISTLEIESTINSAAFSVEIDADLWTNSGEQKLTLKYPDREGATFGATSLDYTLGLKEITLERK